MHKVDVLKFLYRLLKEKKNKIDDEYFDDEFLDDDPESGIAKFLFYIHICMF